MHRRYSRALKIILPCFLVIFGTFLLAHTVFAADPSISAAGWVSDWTLTGLAKILSYIAAGLGQLTITVIEALIVPILNYNSFGTSPIIGLGWSLVRDVMNMFVIVALLFIAIFTIVGNHRAHWEQQIPQLFIAVVLMNFSRTICGILIDISQVIMFTFVNALLDIAAGNIAQLLHLQQFGQYIDPAEFADPVAIAEGLSNGARNLIGAFLMIPLYGSILAVMLLLALAFLWRIVILWVLVVLSPAAFFLGGVGGIFHGADGAAKEWWGKFTAALAMGPLLAFFLWLALAAASSGSLVQSENFPTGGTPFLGLPLEVFQPDTFLSILLALVLLIVGMREAGSYAGKLEGVAKSVINEGVGRKVVSGALRWSSTTPAGYVGRSIDRGVGRKFGVGTLREGFGKGAISAGEALSRAPYFGPVGRAIGGAFISAGGSIEHQGEHLRKDRIKAASDRWNSLSETQQASELALALEGRPSASWWFLDAEAKNVALGKLATSKPARKELEQHLQHSEDPVEAKRKYDRYMRATVLMTDKEANAVLDDNGKRARREFQSGNLDYFLPEPIPDDATQAEKNEYKQKYDEGLKRAKELIDKDEFKSEYRKLNGRPQAFEDDKLFAALENTVVRNTANGPVTVVDEALAGTLGQSVKEAVEKRLGSKESRKLEQARSTGDFSKVADDLRNQRVKPENITVNDLSSGAGAADIGAAVVNAGVSVDKLGGGDVQVRNAFTTNVTQKQTAEVITKALNNGQVKPSDIPTSAFTESNDANRHELISGLSRASADISSMSAEAQEALRQATDDLRNSNRISTKEARDISAMLLAAGKEVASVISGASKNADGTLDLNPQAQRELRSILKAQPQNYRLISNVPVGDARNPWTQYLSQTVTKEDLRTLAKLYEESVGKMKEEYKKTLDVLDKSIEREVAEYAAGGGVSSGRKRIDELDEENLQIRSRIGLE